MVTLMGKCKPLIGVVHLPPLPGSPGYRVRRWPPGAGRRWSIEDIVEYAVSEARSYVESGFDAVIVENYGDTPYPKRPTPLQVAAMARVVSEVVRAIGGGRVGVNMLRNGAAEAIAVAVASGAGFVRVNSLCETRLTPEGLIEPEAQRVAWALRAVDALDDAPIQVLADVDVKHSYPLAKYSVKEAVKDCIERSGVPLAAVIVTGSATGEEATPVDVEEAASAARPYGVAVVVGSGVSTANLPRYWHSADGFIVGSSVKVGGVPWNPVDREKASALAALASQYRRFSEECEGGDEE
ncbi:MAG: BtpA/SgcQ family protein [Desulfurococcales archaeon]|nr:BtpA/SgcQ family protein [Desulfurococcales archaeon]